MKLKLPDNPLQFIYKLKLPERMAIGGVIMFLVGYIVYSLIIPAQLLNLKSVRRQLLVQRDLIQSKKDKVRRLLILEERYNQLQGEVDKNNQKFFSDEQAIDFLKGLNELVESQTNNDLVLIRPSSEEILSESLLGVTKCVYKRQDVQVIVMGKFDSILELFHRLYTSGKLLSIKEIEIEVEKEIPLMLKADFLLSMHLLSQATERDADSEIE